MKQLLVLELFLRGTYIRNYMVGVFNGWGGQTLWYKCQNVLLSTLQNLSRYCSICLMPNWQGIVTSLLLHVFSLHSACLFAFTTHWLCSAGPSDSTFLSFLFSFCSVYVALYLRAQSNGQPLAIFREFARDDRLHAAPACQNGRLKHTSTSSSSSFDTSQSEKKDKRQITISTFEWWQGQYNAPHESLTWLQCDKDPSDRSPAKSMRTKDFLKCMDLCHG